MTCPHCYQNVPEGSVYCPYCGARLSAPIVGTSENADPTYLDVARANLQRMRGEWEQAQQQTVEILRHFPNSPTAHSLLGDIFADQGQDAEAIQWYQMALDLDPENKADARKLAAAEARVRDAERPVIDEAEKKPAFSAFRVMAAACGVSLVAIIVLGFALHARWTPPPDNGAYPRDSWKPNASVTPPAVAVIGPQVGSEPPDAQRPVNPPAPLTDREGALFAALAPTTGSAVAAPVRVASVVVDERDNDALVTVVAQNVDGKSPDWPGVIHSGALSAAQSSLKADSGLAGVSVRVVMIMDVQGVGQRWEVAFEGFLRRPAAENNKIPVTFDQRWWRGGITPPAGTETTPWP